jgi:hypothetical protein
MRVNTRNCLAALKRGKAYRAESGAVHTDGRVIRSYGQVIACPDPADPGTYLVTDKRWSQTTTVQTNGVAIGLLADGFKVKRVTQEEVNRAGAG